ncbi:MAG: GIY-YIG nuclease family protein [Glycocaulis sp.]
MSAYIYILASKRNGTLYVGSCANPAERIAQHRMGKGSEFVWKYKVFDLVYLEHCGTTHDAIARERQVKHWNRAWKIALIEQHNAEWRDLYPELNNLMVF